MTNATLSLIASVAGFLVVIFVLAVVQRLSDRKVRRTVGNLNEATQRVEEHRLTLVRAHARR